MTTTGFDAVSRLASIAQDLSGTSYDATTTFAYTPSSQIASTTRTNDAYAWNGHANVDRAYTSNGLLNQLTAAGRRQPRLRRARQPRDAPGSDSYGYSSENLLTSGAGKCYAGPMIRASGSTRRPVGRRSGSSMTGTR